MIEALRALAEVSYPVLGSMYCIRIVQLYFYGKVLKTLTNMDTLMFTEEYLDSLPAEPLLALEQVVDFTIDFWNNLHGGKEHHEYSFFLEALAICNALIQNTDIKIEKEPVLEVSTSVAVENIYSHINHIKSSVAKDISSLKSARFKAKYDAKFGNVFAYEFTDGDIDRIQTLISELRASISKSEEFGNDHKLRLLAKLEKLQSELHKKMGNIDVFWGLMGEAGVACGKFGIDAKPLVDRFKEIMQIGYRAQARAEGLPSDSGMDILGRVEPTLEEIESTE